MWSQKKKVKLSISSELSVTCCFRHAKENWQRVLEHNEFIDVVNLFRVYIFERVA